MGHHRKYLNRSFSVDKISANIKISLSGRQDEVELLAELKKCLQKWSRRVKNHGDSRVGYCIELEERNAS